MGGTGLEPVTPSLSNRCDRSHEFSGFCYSRVRVYLGSRKRKKEEGPFQLVTSSSEAPVGLVAPLPRIGAAETVIANPFIQRIRRSPPLGIIAERLKDHAPS
jgi:hypothetical protein